MPAFSLKRSMQLRMAAWVRKRQGLDALPLTLQRRRIYILPTRAGVAFGCVVFFMLIAGMNYANSLALFLSFLLAGFGLVCMQQCHRNLLGTCLNTASAPPAFAGGTGRLEVTLESPPPLARYRVEAGFRDDPLESADLLAGERVRLDLPLQALKRGIVHVDRLKLTSAHPFGLFRAWTWVHAPLEMIVYPRPHGSTPMPTEAGRKSGKHMATEPGSDEWLGLRPFRDGDSPRQVDWKAYAREAPLLVKEYSAASSELRVFRFAHLPDMATEQRLEQLARWIVDAETQGDRYGLELPGVRIAADRGGEHRHLCLAALARYE
jgi:uncharacterized protein (DUF58 family)